MSIAFRIRLRLFATASGGRATAIRSDYRPDWDLGSTWRGRPTLNGGRVMLEDRPELSPGAEGIARVEPLAPEFWEGVRPGQIIPMHEGSRVVGEATVLETLDPEF